MPIEIGAPDGSIVRFPDGTPDATITNVMRANFGGPAPEAPESWGEYGAGLARQALGQGLALGAGDGLEARARAIAGGGKYEDILADIRKQNAKFAERHPVQSAVANVAGGAPLFLVNPGAGAIRAIAAAKTLPQAALRSAGLGAGVGGIHGFN